MEKKTKEQFQKELNEIHNNEYTVLGEYINNKTKILVKHNICGLEWYVIPKNILHGSKCPNCNGHTIYTNETFKNKIYELVENEYTFLESYNGYDEKIKARHNICGNEYEVAPHWFISGNRCPKCQHRSYKKTTEEYITEIKNIWGDEFEIVSEYKNVNTKIDVIHKPCGKLFNVSPRGLLYGEVPCNCNKINPKMKTDEYFKEEINTLTNGEYINLDTYIGAQNSIRFKHIKCGTIFETTPHRFLLGHTMCPLCNGSRGEQLIQLYLERNKIRYKREFTFSDCKNINVLPFDVAMFLNDDIQIIEFHGKQHYEPIEWFGGIKGFKYRKHNDEIKYNYCISNNIKIMIIPYWDMNNMTDILDNFIKNIENDNMDINEFKADGCQLF